MNNITDEERKVIDELRRRTINYLSPKALEDEFIFYRFAKARDFNLEEAEAMLNKHITWRKEYEIDTILTDYEPPEVLAKYLCSSFICHDKEGGVVRLQDWGRGDMTGISNCVTKEEVAKYWFYLGEKDKSLILKRGGDLSKPIFHVIYDTEGLTYSTAVHVKSLQCLLFGVKLLLDNYPECVKTITIINTPFYFSWVYAILKPILPAVVCAKFQIFGTDGWKESLLKTIEADELPACLGGNKTDPDGNPLCETIILRAKPVPKRYYRKKGSGRLLDMFDAEKVAVKPLSHEEITIEVKEENLYLEWEIEIKNRDIDFSLKYEGYSNEDFEHEEVIPKQRINSFSETEKGCIRCEKTGKYTMVFDNSFTWIHSKEVYYRIRLRNKSDNELI